MTDVSLAHRAAFFGPYNEGDGPALAVVHNINHLYPVTDWVCLLERDASLRAAADALCYLLPFGDQPLITDAWPLLELLCAHLRIPYWWVARRAGNCMSTDMLCRHCQELQQ